MLTQRFRGSSATFIDLPDLDYGRTPLARGLGDGEVLFPTWGTDLAPLQHLLRVAVLGLTLEYLGRDSSRDYPLQADLLREHRVSLRQTVASIGTLVIYLIATKDGFISRVFLFNFVPCFTWRYFSRITICRPFWPAGFLREFAGRKPCWLAVRAFLPPREIHRTHAAVQSNSLPHHRENPFATRKRREIAAMSEMAAAAKGFSVFGAGRPSDC